MLVLMQLARLLDMESKRVTASLRTVYLASHALQLGILMTVRMRLSAAPKDPSELDNPTGVEIVEDGSTGGFLALLSSLQQGGGPTPASQRTRRTMSIRAYDLQELRKLESQTLQNFILMFGIHLVMGYTQPLFSSSISPWRTLLTAPVIRLRLYGERTGDSKLLKRPFTDAPSPFAALMESQNAPSAAQPTATRSGPTGAPLEPSRIELVSDNSSSDEDDVNSANSTSPLISK